MDLVCINCGEPWDILHVIHDEPQSFKREGSAIRQCPCCDDNEQYQEENLTEKEKLLEKERLEAVEMVCDLLGDDIDGAAAFLEDFGLV